MIKDRRIVIGVKSDAVLGLKEANQGNTRSDIARFGLKGFVYGWVILFQPQEGLSEQAEISWRHD